MTEEMQKKIFSKNLNYYISLSGKQQKEVAKDLSLSPQTFNNWCTGKIVPSMGKIQKLADYFGIGKSDLVDNKLDGDPALDARIINDIEVVEMIRKFYMLSKEDQQLASSLISSLSEKTTGKSSPQF